MSGSNFELYNLAEDIGESKILLQQYSNKVSKMHEQMSQRLSETKAQLPVVNPDYKADSLRR